jgi:hypothetical protein
MNSFRAEGDLKKRPKLNVSYLLQCQQSTAAADLEGGRGRDEGSRSSLRISNSYGLT